MMLIGGIGPVMAVAGAVISAAIELRTRRKPTDLPILLALPDLEPQPAEVAAARPGPAEPQPRLAGSQSLRTA